MLRRDTPLYRRILMAVAGLVVIGAGAFAYYLYARSAAADNSPKIARETYERGRQALDDKDSAKALTILEEARGLTEKALVAREEEIKKAQNAAPEKEKKWQERAGNLLWLRARILCDLAYAARMQENNPLAETVDATTGEKFRSVMRIPNSASRNDAINCLRQAGALLPRDLQVQQDVLRLEVMTDEFFWNWANIQRVAERVVEIDRANVRANYFLARAKFEQYREERVTDQNGNPLTVFKETAPAKRRREQVEAARAHLQFVKQAENNPIWRTLYLEAQIIRWLLRETPATTREKPRKEETQFKDLLFNQALPRARRQEKFANLSKVDVDGLIGLHDFAVDQGIEQARATLGMKAETLFQALRDFAALADNLWANEFGERYRGELLEANLRAAARARRSLGAGTLGDWPAVRDRLETLAGRAAAAGINCPDGYALLAYLLNTEAFLEGKRYNAAAKAVLDARAVHWINQGLELAVAAQAPSAALVEIHGIALEILIGRGEKNEVLGPHLEALRKSRNDKRAAAILDVLEAAVCVRQGKLTTAKTRLDDALKNPEIRDLRPRALTLLASVLLSTRQPSQAALVLKQLRQSYKRVEDFNPVERAWLLEFLRDPQEISLLIVSAELDTAIEKYERFLAESGGRRALDQAAQESIKSNEDAAVAALSQLKPNSEANLKARTTFVAYSLRFGRVGRAAADLNLLKTDYPRSAAVLRFEVALAVLAARNVSNAAKALAEAKSKGDAIIQAFLQANPTDSAANRFWAEWLIRTGRPEDALAYLKDLNNFAGSRDAATERMLAIALLNNQERDEGARLVQQLVQQAPNDRSLEILLIQTTANPVVRQKLLEDALNQHGDNGLLRLLQAEQLMAQRKNAEAAVFYCKTLEYTQVTDAARAGLRRSMWKVADANPDDALALVDQLSRETPAEAALFAVAAYAKIKKDELGRPADSWERNKTMHGALNSWERLAAKRGMGATEMLLIRAQFWLIANRADQAWDLLKPQAAAGKVRLLTDLVELALDSDDGDKLGEAVKYVAWLKEAAPNSAAARLLDARLIARMGDRRKAAADLEDLLRRSPKLSAAYPLLIRIQADLQQTDKARFWTEAWRKQEPSDPVPVMESIRLRLVTGELDAARFESEEFIRAAVERARSRLPKSADSDIEKNNREVLRNASISACLNVAMAWHRAEQFAGAERYFSECLRIDPKNVSTRLLRAQNELVWKNWPRAREIYEEILKDDSGNQVARTNLAWLLAVHLGREAEALKLIRENLENPHTGKPVDIRRLSPDFLDTLGQVFTAAARKNADRDLFGEMRDIFAKATERYRSDPRLYRHWGDALAGTRNEQAAQAYQAALKLLGDRTCRLPPDERDQLIRKVTQALKTP